MGNEQQGGTSHHFLPVNSQDEQQQKGLWTKNGRIPPGSKPNWQMSRDASMDILSRKTTKLSFKQAPTPSLLTHRSVTKKFPGQDTSILHKPLPIYQTPRMPTEKEVAQIAIAYQLLCSFCDGPCIGDYLRCRVCIKTYHCQCLFERGHLRSQSFSLPRMSKQDWACPECKDLTRLLSQEEMNCLIAVFEQIDRNKDGYISRDEFVVYHQEKSLPELLKVVVNEDRDFSRQYQLMDLRRRGTIDWSEFVLFSTCRLIAGKTKTELSTKLTQKEMVFAKNLFLKDPRIQVGHEGNIICGKEHLSRVVYELTLLLKKKYTGDFIDAVLDDYVNRNETFEKLSVFAWEEFLRQISLLILLNRSNSDVKTQPTRRLSMANLDLDARRTKKPETFALTSSLETNFEQNFRKHEKILDKLQQREDEAKKKSLNQCSVVECLDDEIDLPRLKSDARDERQTITQPWTIVKEMQHLRSQPVLISRVHMLKV